MADTDIDIIDVAQALAKVQLNYNYLAQAWYDVFYNPVPMEVEIQFYDDAGNPKLYKIPNRASDRALFVNGSGEPEGVQAGKIGTIYQDTDTGVAYIKTSGESMSSIGWTQLISQNDLNKIILRGSQSPEGFVTAPAGVLYVNTDEEMGTLYMKRKSTGNTGWERIDSYPTSFVRDPFKLENKTQVVRLNSVCDNSTLLSVYLDGTLLNPDMYELWEDKRTIEFKEPLEIPESREYIDLIAQYFTDLHLDQGVITEELRQLSESAQKAADTCKTVSTEVIKASDALQVKIDTAVDTATTEAVQKIQDAYKDEADRLTDIANKIDNDMTNMYNTVITEYRDIQDWYEKISESRVTISEIQRDVTAIQANIRNTANTFVELYGEDNVMLKKDYVPELERLDSKINSEVEKTKNEYKADIASVNDSMNAKEANLKAEIERIDTALTTSDSELRGIIGSYEETNQAWHDAQQDDINFIKQQYFNKDNLPIDINGIYNHNKLVNTDAKSTVTSDTVIINIRKDCKYYTVDLGTVMNKAHTDCTFDFSMIPGGTVVTGFDDIDPAVENGSKVDSDNFTGVLCSVRVMFQNESIYTPFIEWDNKITWLGEEPEIEGGKNYLVEFISYDMMGSWYAHVLGICQPAVRVDTFTANFIITLSNYTGTNNAKVDLYYDLDGMTKIYDGEYTIIDNKITFSEEIERIYRNTELSNLRVHASTDNLYVKHISQQTFTLQPDGTYNATIDWNNTVKERYTFTLTLTNGEIDNYIIADETVQATTLADFNKYNSAHRIKCLYETLNGITTEYTYVGMENLPAIYDEDNDLVQAEIPNYYIVCTDPSNNTKKFVTSVAVTSNTISYLLRSPYAVEDPTDPTHKKVASYVMPVKVRLGCTRGQYYPETTFPDAVYTYIPSDLTQQGCVLIFDNVTHNLMDSNNVIESDKYVDNSFNKIDLWYPALTEVELETSYKVPCLSLIDGQLVDISLDGTVNVSLANEGAWSTRNKVIEGDGGD